MREVSELWNPAHHLVLASKSASRRGLLAAVGIPFEAVSAEIEERAIEDAFFARGGAGEELAAHLARAKALEVSRRRPKALCLGADQVLSLDGRIFHKADSLEEARNHLAQLAGRTHRLTSAFAIAWNGEILHEAEDHAELSMRPLDAPGIARYLDIVGPTALTSVGGYQIEAIGAHLFERVQGDHSTILGLPILPLLAWLRSRGAILL